MRRILFISIVILVILGTVESAQSSSVTIINEANLPWLVRGSYADYLGGQLGYVLPNGTLTLSGLTTASLGFSTSSGNTTMEWTVLNRTGNLAWIQVRYHAVGCDSSESQYNDYYANHFNHPLQCVPVDFNTTLTLQVNVPTREAYMKGQALGIINFWAPPLLNGQPAYVGTAFVDGVPHDLVANSSGLSTTGSGSHALVLGADGRPLTVDESGNLYSGPFKFYTLGQTTFGTGPNSTYGWIKSEGGALNGNTTFIPKSNPSGLYSYYNGLALQLSQPEYPIPQTVCVDDNGQPVSCEYTTYGTTLGNYFRSSGGELYLTATNIPLEPSQSPTNPTFFSLPLVTAVAGAVFGAMFAMVYIVSRRNRGP